MSYLQRRRADGEGQRATTLELFYDLVFVFAITQVSHLLLEHLSWVGVGQSLLVLLVVWWSWNYTTWVTNELDTETVPVRLLLISLMLASLLMAVAIPRAFDDHALLFAGSYVAIQVGRHTFLTFAAAEPGTLERERAGRILTWFVAAGVLWTTLEVRHWQARLHAVVGDNLQQAPIAEVGKVQVGFALRLLEEGEAERDEGVAAHGPIVVQPQLRALAGGLRLRASCGRGV